MVTLLRVFHNLLDHIGNTDKHPATAGEANTASNRAAAGVFSQKSGVDLQFRGITAASNRIQVTLNDPTITINATEANFTLDNIGGTLAISKGGTGQTTATAAFNALDPLTTKGDVAVHNGTDTIRLAVGANNQVLTADSAQAAGIKWAAAGGGSTVTISDKEAGDTITTTSTSFVDMPGMSFTWTPSSAENIVIHWSAIIDNTTTNTDRITMLVDATTVSEFLNDNGSASAYGPMSFFFNSSVTANVEHNVRIRWLTSGGTATCEGTNNRLRKLIILRST